MENSCRGGNFQVKKKLEIVKISKMECWKNGRECEQEWKDAKVGDEKMSVRAGYY